MPSLSQRAQRAGHTLVTEALPHGMHGRHPQTEQVEAPSYTTGQALDQGILQQPPGAYEIHDV